MHLINLDKKQCRGRFRTSSKKFGHQAELFLLAFGGFFGPPSMEDIPSSTISDIFSKSNLSLSLSLIKFF